jgi:oligopeptidase B
MRWILIAFVTACRVAHPTVGEITPPVAAKKPHPVVSENGTRDDPYYWLRDDTRTNKEVIADLEAENRYAAAMLRPAKPLEEELVREIRRRVDETEDTVPVFEDGYWYYARYEADKQRPIYARRKGTMQAAEQIVLDANALAVGHDFYSIGTYDVSRDGKLVAWADDSVGRNQFMLHIKNLATGQVLPDTAPNISPSIVWANDNETVFYVGKDDTTLREDRVLRHELGDAADVLVYREKDESYYVGISKSKSDRYIEIELDATDTSETRLVDADQPDAPVRVALPRVEGEQYSLDHIGSRFVMRTNARAENFRIVDVPDTKLTDRSAWHDLVPGRDDALVEGFAVYDTFLAATVRVDGLSRVQVLPATGKPFFIEADDPASSMSVIDTPGPAATRVRYAYDSLVTPETTYELDVATRDRTLLKRDKVPTYDPSKYASEYIRVAARDGARVPVSIVYRKDTKRDGTAPLLLHAYGAYGESLDPGFDSNVVSLLDRGFVYAIAHVRGGMELGQAWYDAGRLLNKKNTFNDFIDVTEHLVKQRYAARDKVFAEGASAGGLLVSAVATMRPDLYRGIVDWVPYVDVVTTMLDPTIPLTTNEYDEWGDPKEKAAYDYMLSYSPYDNVKAQAYPALYVRSGLWDSQVQYFEPAKWVAKLRATKTDKNLLVFETDMHAGHEGTSGRFEQIREEARAYAFMLYVLGTSPRQ